MAAAKKGNQGKRSLPFVFINVATTADGKIAPANRRFVPFGSKRDHELLLQLRTRADAVMSGARTIDTFPVTMGPGGAKYRKRRLKQGLAEYNMRVVVSGSASVNPDAEIFKHHFSPIIILASKSADPKRVQKLQQLGAHVAQFGKSTVDFKAALVWLREKWNVKTLLCEGGGEVNAALFAAGLVDEVHQTICPFIFGGRNAPTLADGEGVRKLGDSIQLKMKTMKKVGAELFLTWSVLK